MDFSMSLAINDEDGQAIFKTTIEATSGDNLLVSFWDRKQITHQTNKQRKGQFSKKKKLFQGNKEFLMDLLMPLTTNNEGGKTIFEMTIN